MRYVKENGVHEQFHKPREGHISWYCFLAAIAARGEGGNGLADVPLPSLYRMGCPSGTDFIRRGEDNVFMDVSYTHRGGCHTDATHEAHIVFVGQIVRRCTPQSPRAAPAVPAARH